jgi:dienelactone hydrolase
VPPAEVASGRMARGPFPLVVFAPGYLQCGSSYAALLRAWASAGYVVATVEFPRTHCHIAVPDEADLSNQPADVSAVITRLLAASARPAGTGSGNSSPGVSGPGGTSSASPLAGRIDPARIAVAGHSDGGDTAAAVAANTCCLDSRVKAAMILSGAQWPALGGRYFPPGTPPVLFVQGTSDTWNPPAASTGLYQADTTGTRYFLTLLGADHFSPYEGHGKPEPLVARVTLAFLNAYLDGQGQQVATMRAAGNVAGVAVLSGNGRLPP